MGARAPMEDQAWKQHRHSSLEPGEKKKAGGKTDRGGRLQSHRKGKRHFRNSKNNAILVWEQVQDHTSR